MQPNPDNGDPELLALARATDQLAATIVNSGIAKRLREIADEVRSLARQTALS